MGLPPSGVVATAAPDPELTAMLARAAVSIGLEVNRPPSPEPSQLDDWFLGAGRGSQPKELPFFPEVHEELAKSWMAPFTARSCSSVSSVLTILDGGVARGYAGIPQVERAVAVHLCPRNAATWRNRPCLPSKAYKLTAALAAKAYSAAGQAASALHAMAILQVHHILSHESQSLPSAHESQSHPSAPESQRHPSASKSQCYPSAHESQRFQSAPVQLTFASAGPVQLTLPSAGPVQLTLASAGPVQLTLASAGPVQLTFASAGPVQLTLASAGPVQPPSPPLVPSSSPSSPLALSSSALPECPQDSALHECPRESALPERPRESALPERPQELVPSSSPLPPLVPSSSTWPPLVLSSSPSTLLMSPPCRNPPNKIWGWLPTMAHSGP